MNRRGFIQWSSAALAGAIALPWGVRQTYWLDLLRSADAQDALVDLETARRIAEAVSQRGDLVDRALALEGLSVYEARTRLAAQDREDYRLGRTVEVDGWILSETCVRLCLQINRFRPI